MKQALLFIMFFYIAYSFTSCKQDDGGTDPPQNLKEITGSVKGENNNAYPNTKIILFNPSNQKETSTISDGTYGFNLDEDGAYTIAIVPPLSSTIDSDDSTEVIVQVDVEKTVNFIVRTEAIDALVVKGSIDIFGEIRNETGMLASETDEPIYARNVFDSPIGLLTPIKAPDGHQLSLSEWGTAQGKVLANCNGNTTNVEVDLQGMIPNGIYTFWLDFLNKKKGPGEFVDIGVDVANIEPLGSGTLNVAQANNNGIITASIDHTSCILTKEAALVLVVVYHINGNTFGTAHIPDEEDVSHMLVYFQ